MKNIVRDGEIFQLGLKPKQKTVEKVIVMREAIKRKLW